MSTKLDFSEIWEQIRAYDGSKARNTKFDAGTVKLYMGAMEIPLVVFTPKNPVSLSEEFGERLSALLSSLDLVFECVEEGNNYKINTRDDRLYVGRITPESLKLHAVRIRQVGYEGFCQIAGFYLNGDSHE